MRHLYQMLLILLSFSTAACATIGTGEPSITDTPRPDKRIVVPVEGVAGAVDQDGSNITVHAWHVCGTAVERSAVRTTTTKAINKSATIDWTLAGLGLASVALGTVFVVDSKDKEYMGYGLIVPGVILGTVALVDVIRANHTTVDTREVKFPAERIGQSKPCPDKRYVGAKVMVQYLGRDYLFGETDGSGELAANLDANFPDDLVFDAHNLKAEVLVFAAEEKLLNLGKVDLKEVYKTREARAWGQVAPACESPTAPTSCNPVEEFLRQYPSGPNAAQARTLLARTRPGLDATRDEAEWSGIKPDDCAIKVKGEDSSDVEKRCRPLRVYLSRFPQGNHAAEARAALDKGEARIDILDAAMRREMDESKRRIDAFFAAEERRQREQERSRCRAECKMGCGRYGYSECVSACIQLKCK